MRASWSSIDLIKAEQIPPRRVGDFVLRATKGLPVALAIFCVIAFGLIAAAFVLPATYSSSAAVLLTPGNGDPAQAAAPDAAARSAVVDQGVGLLNSPVMAGRILAALQRKSPQVATALSAGAGGSGSPRIVRASRRDESYIVDVTATASSPLAARSIAEVAIDIFQDLQLDERLNVVGRDRAPPAPLSNPAVGDPNATLLRLELEKAALQKATRLISPSRAISDDARKTALDLAEARADAAAMKALLRSEVTGPDVANFRASGAIDRLGDVGPAFAADLLSYEAVLEAGKSDLSKAEEGKYRKYKILTAASQLQPGLDARVARLAAASAALAAARPPAQSPEAIARLAQLDRQIDEQRKLATAAISSAPASQTSATIGATPGAVPIDVRVVSRPGPGVAVAWRQALFLYPAALGIALILALAYLVFVMFASNTIMDPRDAAALASAPLLAAVSRISPAQLRSLPPGDRHPANYPIENPASSFADAMRATLAGLRQFKDEKATCIAVAGAQVGDGASTISLALARTAAAAGVRVLLIDTDFADAGLTKAMGIEPASGIEAILGGHRQLADLVVEDHMTSVHLLPSAPSESSRGALSLTQLNALKAMLASARLGYDMIVIDCQPHSTRARTRSMARMADTVLIVAAYEITKRDVMSVFARRMQHNGVAVCGVVFNFLPDRSARSRIDFMTAERMVDAPPVLPPIGSNTAIEVRSIH